MLIQTDQPAPSGGYYIEVVNPDEKSISVVRLVQRYFVVDNALEVLAVVRKSEILRRDKSKLYPAEYGSDQVPVGGSILVPPYYWYERATLE